MRENIIDLFIIGGGINGVGIAVDAAGRGLAVTLCEQHDLASGTSSASSKLIHGGLRYLEYYEFRLVREALREREILLKKAPHLIRPLRFIMPHHSQLRPAWLIRLGLFIYDHLGARKVLQSSKALSLFNNPVGYPLNPKYQRGFSYYDCWVDDSRLVIVNAMAAKDQGATILTYTQFIRAEQEADLWKITVQNQFNQQRQVIYARALVNAAGPWVNIVSQQIPVSNQSQITLLKGSHIVLPKLYQGDFAYIFQNFDKRIIFVLPYLEEYTLIGTTDVPYQGDPKNATISEEEITYLCRAVNQYFSQRIKPEYIIWTYSGIRPLQADAATNPSAMTRDYSLEIHDSNGKLPLLTVLGGKITTYRKLAEQALQILCKYFSCSNVAWTQYASLPGGDFTNADFNLFSSSLIKSISLAP